MRCTRFRRWLTLGSVLLVLAGCVVPAGDQHAESKSNKAERRESAMLKSKIGSTPFSTGVDQRAREIENSLGIP